jgi:hypothetical protein
MTERTRRTRLYEDALTWRGGTVRVWPSEIIRRIAEASEVTRPWRTLNIWQSFKQNIDEWNKWREERPDVVPVLREANLEGANLRGADQTSGEKPPMAGKSTRRRDGVYTMGERQFSISRRARQVELLCPWANPSGEVSPCCWYVASCTAPQQLRTPHLLTPLKQCIPTCNKLQGASVLCAHFRPLIMWNDHYPLFWIGRLTSLPGPKTPDLAWSCCRHFPR